MTGAGREAIAMHFARYLEEIALAVLPRGTDSEVGSDEGSNTPNREEDIKTLIGSINTFDLPSTKAPGSVTTAPADGSTVANLSYSSSSLSTHSHLEDILSIALSDSSDPDINLYRDSGTLSKEEGRATIDEKAVRQELEEEDDSLIKCICGYNDDDGNTVLCDKCNTWQHIACYFDSHVDIPGIHECTDCSPRPVDAAKAAERQRRLIEPLKPAVARARRKDGKKRKTKPDKQSISMPGRRKGMAAFADHEARSVREKTV